MRPRLEPRRHALRAWYSNCSRSLTCRRLAHPSRPRASQAIALPEWARRQGAQTSLQLPSPWGPIAEEQAGSATPLRRGGDPLRACPLGRRRLWERPRAPKAGDSNCSQPQARSRPACRRQQAARAGAGPRQQGRNRHKALTLRQKRAAASVRRAVQPRLAGQAQKAPLWGPQHRRERRHAPMASGSSCLAFLPLKLLAHPP